MARFTIAALDELEEFDDGRAPYIPVRHHLGITTFGINAWTAHAAGDRLINEHDEDEPDSAEELYFVLSGHADFELDGERHEAPAGSFVLVQPGVRRTAFGRSAGTTLLAIGAAPPGQVYEPGGWDAFGPLRKLFDAGDYAAVADQAPPLLAASPQSAGLFYNVACAESLAGRRDAAISHLAHAIGLTPRAADWARDDPDFTALRGDPEFQALTGGC